MKIAPRLIRIAGRSHFLEGREEWDAARKELRALRALEKAVARILVDVAFNKHSFTLVNKLTRTHDRLKKLSEP